MTQSTANRQIEQALKAAIARASSAQATPRKPRPTPAAPLDPIVVVMSCRAAYGGPLVKRRYIIDDTICSRIAINTAERRAQAEGLPDTVLLEVYRGQPE